MAGGGGVSGEPAPSEGVRFLDMVALLSDPVKLQSEYKRLQDERTRLENAIALAGPAAEIVRLRGEAQVDRDAAASELAAARAQIEQLISEARSDASGIIEAARRTADNDVARAAEAKAQADAANNDSLLAQQAAEAAQADVQKKIDELAQYGATLDARLEVVAEREAAADARQARLDAAFEAVRAVSTD